MLIPEMPDEIVRNQTADARLQRPEIKCRISVAIRQTTIKAGAEKAAFGEVGWSPSIIGYRVLHGFVAFSEDDVPQQDNCKQPHESHQA